jgi:fatty acid synthase subunit alpha
MPERAEELKLKDLAETLQSRNFNGRLGKQSSMWLERMISAKMPGGYNITVAKQYLQTRWGLGVGRQESVLLSAIVEPPVARLATTEAANAYLDDTVEKYAAASCPSI